MTNETALEFLEKLKSEKRILDYAVKTKTSGCKKGCIMPFVSIRIYPDGSVFTCCSNFIKNNKLGNIKENTLKEIWNGEKVREIRKKVLSGDYSMCDLGLCRDKIEADISMLSEKCPMPKHISLAYDRECNIACITCRDEKYKNPPELLDFYNNTIYKQLPPFLKEAEEIGISGSGEALFSKHSRELIKKIASENKTVRWCIKTNGILFNKANLEELGIYGRINTVLLSLPAIDKTVYDKIMIGSDYDTVIKNIKEAVYECNQKKTIGHILINSVISNLNYKEIPKLAEFAKQNNITLILTQFCWWGASFGKDYKSVSVWDETHPEFENFKQILKHPALDYDKIFMTPRFKTIRSLA